MERVESGLRWAASVTMLAALFLIFCVVPTESEMGIVQRIFYFHVPCAFTAYAGFLTVAVSSVVYLMKRSVAADRLAIAGAEVGVLFCTLVLVTGPIWARPIWGVWWTWDPQLTLTIILWSSSGARSSGLAMLIVCSAAAPTVLARAACAKGAVASSAPHVAMVWLKRNIVISRTIFLRFDFLESVGSSLSSTPSAGWADNHAA